MSAIINGLGQTRITTYATDGTTPVKRFTLQKEDREGIELRFPKEGATHKLGSGANRAIKKTFFGYRPNLSCRWAVAGDKHEFSISVPVTGLTIGTQYWMDISVAAVTGGTATATGITMSAVEQ